ncbi:hypothetical protein ACFQH6_12115 [Halobacteriaceae archaeon GCM10025711]
MPSRRQLLAGLGTAAGGALAGCTLFDRTTGIVTRKQVHVEVPRRVGRATKMGVAVLAFEPDRGLLHGEYDPEHADPDVENGALTVSEQLHEELTTRFEGVRFYVNVVPEDGSNPAGGNVDRQAFNALSVGGTATVGTYFGDDRSGRLRLHDTVPRERTLQDSRRDVRPRRTYRRRLIRHRFCSALLWPVGGKTICEVWY